MKKVKVFLHNINLSRVICDHLFNKSHTEVHRIGVGFVFIVIGVFVSKIETTYHAIHFLLDGFGYGIHGIGVAPIIDKLTSLANKEEILIENDIEATEAAEEKIEI